MEIAQLSLEIIKRCKTSYDEEAWKTLIAYCVPEIDKKIARYFPGNPEEVADVRQSMLVDLPKMLNRFQIQSSSILKFKAWILEIAKNTAISAFRKKIAGRRDIRKTVSQNSLDSEKGSFEIEDDIVTPDIYAVNNDNYQRLLEALLVMREEEQKKIAEGNKKASKHSELIEMKYLDEMTNKEIATQLKMNEKTVGTSLIRGLQRLRTLFNNPEN